MMDPHANLREQRELARRIQQAENNEDPAYNVGEDADRLAELVLALDEWRTKGGFDPYAEPSPR